MTEVTELPGVAEAREAPPREGCDGLMATQVLARVRGLTYRQLDYWSRSGRLAPHTHDPKRSEGSSGVPYCWPPDQVILADRIYRLTTLGFSLVAATDLANSREKMAAASRLLDALVEEIPGGSPSVPPGFVEGM